MATNKKKPAAGKPAAPKKATGSGKGKGKSASPKKPATQDKQED